MHGAEACVGIAMKSIRSQIGNEIIPALSLRKILDGLEKNEQVKVFKGITVSCLFCLNKLI